MVSFISNVHLSVSLFIARTVHTWNDNRLELHGQCDIVMVSVHNFARTHDTTSIDLDIHLRTQVARYRSYIKSAAIRIGHDILEVQGTTAGKDEGGDDDDDDKLQHWINHEYMGGLTPLAGLFPINIGSCQNKYTVDLHSVYRGQAIEIQSFNGFVTVKIVHATEASFGKSVGILGDFVTGTTYARDGATILNDSSELGNEWQVLPSDGMLFRESTNHPQFPESCLLPEDANGEKKKEDKDNHRSEKDNISREKAEAACGMLKDPIKRKDCVPTILLTQDIEMVKIY